MRATYTGLIALAGLLLAGCVMQPPLQQQAPGAPAGQLLEALRSGRAILDCRETCLAAWQQEQPRAAQLDAAGAWGELAVLVMRIGYQDDLSLYYLGRAAEGLGAGAAARRYYNESIQVSATWRACRVASRLCGGLVLPRATAMRLAVLDGRGVPGAVPRRGRPETPRPTPPGEAIPLEPGTSLPSQSPPPPIEFPVTSAPAPAPLPEAAPAPAPAVQPAAVAAPAPAPVARAPAAMPASPEFIEPPPAPR